MMTRTVAGRGQANVVFLLVMFAVSVGTLALTPAAKAEIISISATDFVVRCPCVGNAQDATQDNGLVLPVDQTRFFASVPFPTNNQKVCSFSLVYQDINNNNAMTARLLRKVFVVGSNPTAAPVVMATVNTAIGVLSSVRKVTTTTIATPTIVKGNAFYYVEVFAPEINLNFLGVQIDHRATCP
jgi:hypothetical protein